MSGLNMLKECHFEITAENGEAELQTDTVQQETHMHVHTLTLTYTQVV